MSLYIISGTTLGTSEYAAEAVANYCQSQGVENIVLHNPSYEQAKDASKLVVICSTHGDGEFPDGFQGFVQDLVEDEQAFTSPDFKLLLIGIGSKDYDTFNGAIKRLHQIFVEEKNISPVAEPLLIDVSNYANDPEDLSVEFFTEHQAEFLA